LIKKQRSATAPNQSTTSSRGGDEPYETIRIDNLIQHCSCIICLELPRADQSVYQCTNGHICCSACISHLIADSALKDTKAVCPTCRTKICWHSIVRNRTVEKTAQELPQECQYCREKQSTASIKSHEDGCQSKVVVCKFKWAGCQWKAKASEVENHLNNDCAYRQKTAVDLVTHCKGELAKSKIARMEKRNILDMLSSQDIGYKDVKLSAFRTDNYQSKLQFESEEFQLLGSAWQLKGKITCVENHPSRPTNESDRSIHLELKLRDAVCDEQKEIEYLIMKSPGSPIDLHTMKYYFMFDEQNDVTPLNKLRVKDDSVYNQIIGSLAFTIRVFLFEGTPAVLQDNNNADEPTTSAITSTTTTTTTTPDVSNATTTNTPAIRT